MSGFEDAELEAAILALLDGRTTTVCPSEVARALADEWRPLMQPVRAAAVRLVDHGLVEVTQQDRRVDPRTARGPIRLRLR